MPRTLWDLATLVRRTRGTCSSMDRISCSLWAYKRLFRRSCLSSSDCGWKIDGKTNTKRKARLNAEHDHLQVACGNTPYRHSRKIKQTQMANCGTSLGYQGTHLLVTERHRNIYCLHWWTPHICWLIFSFVVWLMPFLFVDWLNHESTSMLDTPKASWCTSPGSYKCPLVSWHNSHLPCVDDLN